MGKYQPFFDLPAAQFQTLVDDVAKRGVLLPIIVDEDGQVIDGHQRRRAAAEANVDCPQVVVAGLSEQEKQTLALTLNLFRRHLSGTERAKALQQLANLGLSTRRMADILGVSKSTVHNDLQALSSSGQWERPDTVVGEDGRRQPSTKPERPPANIDPETGEIVGDGADQDQRGSYAPTAPGSSPALTSGEEGPSTASRSDDEAKVASPSSPVPPIDPTLGYRATASRFKAQVRSSLLTLDPERVIETSDDHKAWADLAADLHAFADRIDQALTGPKLKAVK